MSRVSTPELNILYSQDKHPESLTELLLEFSVILSIIGNLKLLGIVIVSIKPEQPLFINTLHLEHL